MTLPLFPYDVFTRATGMALGVALLLWHELARMAGRPWGAAGMLVSAAVWATKPPTTRIERIQEKSLRVMNTVPVSPANSVPVSKAAVGSTSRLV